MPSPERCDTAILVRALLAGLLIGGALATACAQGSKAEPELKAVYLSDTPGSAYEWLEGKQKEAYGPKRHPTGEADLRRVSKNLPRREGWEDANSLIDTATSGIQVPTRYQDLATYILLNRVAGDVRSILPEEQALRVKLIDWGTLPTSEVNASARRIGNRYLILFDEGVFPALYGLLLTVDRTVSFEAQGNRVAIDFSPEAMQAELKKHPEILENFVDTVVAFSVGAALPNIEFASKQEAANLMRQLNAIERFIVGHEFGHIVLNHTDSRLVAFHANPVRGAAFGFTRFGRDWNSELEADGKGQQFAHDARKVDESGEAPGATVFFDAIAGYAPALFMELMEAIEDATLCAASGEGSSRMLTQDDMDQAFREASEALGRKQGDAALAKIDLGCRRTDHPPAWLRSRFATARADADFIKPPRMPSRDIGYARALLANARTLAKLAAPKIKAKLAPEGLAISR